MNALYSAAAVPISKSIAERMSYNNLRNLELRQRYPGSWTKNLPNGSGSYCKTIIAKRNCFEYSDMQTELWLSTHVGH